MTKTKKDNDSQSKKRGRKPIQGGSKDKLIRFPIALYERILTYQHKYYNATFTQTVFELIDIALREDGE